MTVVSCLINSPRARLSMTLTSGEPEVQLYCYLPAIGFALPLCYNVLIIITCLIFGFKTRNLPENFNESRYIFISVCATLFIWIAFIPTYATTSNHQNKNIILILALILNSFVMLLTMFVPRIYALFFVDEAALLYSVTQHTANGRVAPLH